MTISGPSAAATSLTFLRPHQLPVDTQASQRYYFLDLQNSIPLSLFWNFTGHMRTTENGKCPIISHVIWEFWVSIAMKTTFPEHWSASQSLNLNNLITHLLVNTQKKNSDVKKMKIILLVFYSFLLKSFLWDFWIMSYVLESSFIRI